MRARVSFARRSFVDGGMGVGVDACVCGEEERRWGREQEWCC